MPNTNFIQLGNPKLRKKCKPIGPRSVKSKTTKKIISKLIKTLRENRLVGIAAPQIGENVQIFVTEIRKSPRRDPGDIDRVRVYINPKMTWKSKKTNSNYEACSSIIDAKLFAPVKRSEKIRLETTNRKGERIEIEASGLLAEVIQHEYDHLHGIQFTDKITDVKKIYGLEEYRKRVEKK